MNNKSHGFVRSNFCKLHLSLLNGKVFVTFNLSKHTQSKFYLYGLIFILVWIDAFYKM